MLDSSSPWVLLQTRISSYSNRLESRKNNPQTKSIVSESEKQEAKEAIERFLEDSKVYFDPNLKLDHLSKKIHLPARRISNIINDVYGTNFNDFINEYRIIEAKKIIEANPQNITFDKILLK